MYKWGKSSIFVVWHCSDYASAIWQILHGQIEAANGGVSQENNCVRVSFLNKIVAWGLQIY